ncbi:hypothetical protein Lal_00016797 [Lupinus albus]|nr:hypothetical protein Lal_00016797 [Lupinus albus]
MIACSIAAKISELKQPPNQHTLYAATLERVAIPRAVPGAKPNKLAPGTTEPEAVVAFAVVKFVPVSHSPFHVAGIGPIPVSSKLLLSGQIPVSRTPTMTSLDELDSGKRSALLSRPRN